MLIKCFEETDTFLRILGGQEVQKNIIYLKNEIFCNLINVCLYCDFKHLITECTLNN